jgi:AcrR family transcriptional regulator
MIETVGAQTNTPRRARGTKQAAAEPPLARRPLPDTGSTRERLVRAAMRLFAERGFGGTTVGDIEELAGLTRRGGGFYRHFVSKQEILSAGVEAHIAQAEKDRAAVDLLPFGDLRSELTLVCRWLLEILDHLRDLFQVVEREGDRFPELRELSRQQLLEPLHEGAVQFTNRWAEQTGHPSLDPAASALIMVGSAINYRRLRWTYGIAPMGVDDDRFVETWVHYCHDLMTGTST